MRTAFLGLALALGCGPALAQTAPPAADATVSTAPSVGDQIEAFIKAAPVPDVTRDATPGVTSSNEPVRDRKIHGVVEVGVGSNGYRHAYGQATLPVGDNASVSVAIDQTRFNGRLGRGGGYYGAMRPYGGDTFSLGAEWHPGAPSDACRRRFNDLGEPLEAPPGVCRAIERTGP